MTAKTFSSRKRTLAIALFTGVLMFLGMSNAWSERNQNPGVFPPGSHPYGMTYAEWSADWVQWALSIPTDQSPFLDPDGRYCHLGQLPPVFFLGNSFGGEIVRHCTVPVGQSIAFTPGGAFCILGVDAGAIDEDTTRACVEDTLALIANVAADIDGIPLQSLEKYLFISGLFSFTLPDNNPIGLPAGEYQAINGGYFLVHTPLPRGQHVIHFHAEFPAFSFVSDVTYVISVESHH